MSGVVHTSDFTQWAADTQPADGLLFEPQNIFSAGFDAVYYVRAVRRGKLKWRHLSEHTHQGRQATGFVYFAAIGLPYITHVKIGFTSGDPIKRLKSLQTGCPYPMRMIGYVFGDVEREREIHQLIAQNRTVGEWFEFDELVCRVIAAELDREEDF